MINGYELIDNFLTKEEHEYYLNICKETYEGTHGKLVPKGLVQSMQINQDVANITPKDFSPPPFRYMPHIRIPAIKDAEMKHMKNFIEAMGGDTKGLAKRNKSMKVYGS